MMTIIIYNVSGEISEVIENIRKLIKVHCKRFHILTRDPESLIADAFRDNPVVALRLSFGVHSMDWGFVSNQNYYKEDYIESKLEFEHITEVEYKDLIVEKPKHIKVPKCTQDKKED